MVANERIMIIWFSVSDNVRLDYIVTCPTRPPSGLIVSKSLRWWSQFIDATMQYLINSIFNSLILLIFSNSNDRD